MSKLLGLLERRAAKKMGKMCPPFTRYYVVKSNANEMLYHMQRKLEMCS
jgi:hypothetical protein